MINNNKKNSCMLSVVLLSFRWMTQQSCIHEIQNRFRIIPLHFSWNPVSNRTSVQMWACAVCSLSSGVPPLCYSTKPSSDIPLHPALPPERKIRFIFLPFVIHLAALCVTSWPSVPVNSTAGDAPTQTAEDYTSFPFIKYLSALSFSAF